jgi:hypothetical protein
MNRLDALVPRWQFREFHATKIDASPERIFDAIRRVTAGEIRFFRTLTAIRRFGRSEPESILNPPAHEPILDVATRTGFRVLADDAPREIVVGIDVAPETFAAMNFLVIPDRERCRVSTETRVFASSHRAKWKFAIYWAIIRAGSGIIRRSWLRAIKRRAEER